jgi:hypothetical protein
LLGECQDLLHNFLLQAQSTDLWHWQPDPVRGYSVRGAYQLLAQTDLLDGVYFYLEVFVRQLIN